MPEDKTTVRLEDVLDFAYCPLRVWWRKSDLAPGADVVNAPRKQAGEQLLRMAVQQTLFVYHKYHETRAPSLEEALGLVWKIWLSRWGLEEQARPLVEYAQRRAALLARFAPGGDLRRADGQRYQRPMWTRSWMELAASSGRALYSSRLTPIRPAPGWERWNCPKKKRRALLWDWQRCLRYPGRSFTISPYQRPGKCWACRYPWS